MKKQLILCLLHLMLLGCLSYRATAQEGIGARLHSSDASFARMYGAQTTAIQELPQPDLDQILREDARFGWPRYAVEVPVSFDMNRSGEWLTLPNTDRLWRLTIRVTGAKGLLLSYSDFKLPAEGVLHIYNREKTCVLGGFSSFNNADGGRFATAVIPGDELTLEYYEPSFCRGQARLIIDAVGYVYRSMIGERSGGDSLDISCHPEWKNEKRGVLVVLMKFKNSKDVFWLNGALLNNTDQDFTPYVLSSYDAVLGPAQALGYEPEYEQMIFYFNFEHKDCNDVTFSPNLVSMVGCTPVVKNRETSTLLVKINTSIPPMPYNPYFLGWNNLNAIPVDPVCMYVPASGFKRLAGFTSTFSIPADPVQAPVDTSLNYQHDVCLKSLWDEVAFNAPPGAPLLDQKGLVTGIHLKTGGGCSGNEIYFTRFKSSWPCLLSPVLDPSGTGAHTLDGLEGGCGDVAGPVAELDQAVLGKLSAFISKELHGNYKILERAYIQNKSEIDRALTSDDPQYRDLQTALEALKTRWEKTFFRAFVFEKENIVTAEDLNTWKRFIFELNKTVHSDAFAKEIQSVNGLFDAALDKDLKSGLVAFDRASLTVKDELAPPHSSNQLQTTLFGNPGILTTLHYELPYPGEVEITILNAEGVHCRTLLKSYSEAGSNRLTIHKRGLSPGIYFVRCVLISQAGRLQSVRKMLVQ